ncbi:unnamed protein product [Prorocentrum cordatum]|uniref:Uncharacterized protein n=1 Tax=Prorocentrum cordatum TaxID=2364126 RepID=A0ABN9U573_9DINO|nr:unnamed protein product [Polarella glacialis]
MAGAATAKRVALALLGGAAAALAQGVDPLAFGCGDGPHAEAWGSAKRQMRGIFENPSAGLAPTSKQMLRDALESVQAGLKSSSALSAEAAGECGLGRLSIQLLGVATLNPEELIQIFSRSEQLASPVLTALLDLPWLAVAQSGWPVYALLGEINLQRREAGITNIDEVDGLDQPLGQAFYSELTQAIIQGDGAAIGRITNMFLSIDGAQQNAFAWLTALVAGGASAEAKVRVEILDTTQTSLKQILTGAVGLDIAVGTQWPFWGRGSIARTV